MFSDWGNVIIKNEPINTDDIDFVTDSSKTFDLINSKNRPKTVICSESEYLAEGNSPFESIIVKEEDEPKFYDSTTTLDVNECSSNLLVKNWECYICKHVPVNTVDLRRHIRTQHHLRQQNKATHTVPTFKKYFSCDQCDRQFAGHSGLHRHKFIHNGEKSFTCDQCDRKFSQASTLRQHRRIHSGLKPFACVECDRKFSDASAFRRHKQTHSKERPFGCDLCDQRCSRKSTLIRHLGTHTGTKSFVCNICGKKFSRNSTLNHHKLLHAGQFQFECDKCDRKFVTKSSLNYHLQTHNKGPKPFKCDECDRRFVAKGTLNQHKKNAHGLNTTKSSFFGDRLAEMKQHFTNESTVKSDANVNISRTNKNNKLHKI